MRHARDYIEAADFELDAAARAADADYGTSERRDRTIRFHHERAHVFATLAFAAAVAPLKIDAAGRDPEKVEVET